MNISSTLVLAAILLSWTKSLSSYQVHVPVQSTALSGPVPIITIQITNTPSVDSKAILQRNLEATEVKERFQKDGVVPDVIDQPPRTRLNVLFESGVRASLGNRIKRYEAYKQPEVITWGADPKKYYTLILVDPDPPTRQLPFLGELNHWMVVNIIGEDLSTGETKLGYLPPGPPPWTGMHRFVFLVYEQFDRITVKGEDVSRMRFSVRDFAKKYGLGQPVAGDFFKVEFRFRN